MIAPRIRAGWGVGKLMLVLYPFGFGAVAVNVFMAGLLGTFVGLPSITPVWAMVVGVILGLPATWGFAHHIRTLMDRADAGSQDA